MLKTQTISISVPDEVITEDVGDVFQLNVTVTKLPTKYRLSSHLTVLGFNAQFGSQIFELFQNIDIKNMACHSKERMKRQSSTRYVINIEGDV